MQLKAQKMSPRVWTTTPIFHHIFRFHLFSSLKVTLSARYPARKVPVIHSGPALKNTDIKAREFQAKRATPKCRSRKIERLLMEAKYVDKNLYNQLPSKLQRKKPDRLVFRLTLTFVLIAQELNVSSFLRAAALSGLVPIFS